MNVNDVKQIVYKVFNLKNKNQMKNKKLSAILGRDVEVGANLSAEDLTKIENALVVPANTPPEEKKPTEAEASVEEKVEVNQSVDFASLVKNAVAEAVSPITQQLNTLSQRVDVIGGEAGNNSTIVPKVTGNTETDVDPWNDPANPMNQKIDSDLGK